MKQSFGIILSISLLVFTELMSAQALPVAKVVDDLNTEGNNCEQALSIMDVFMNELAAKPADSGYVVLYQDGRNRVSVQRKERLLLNAITSRGFDPTRIAFVRGTEQIGAKTEFWIIPAGAERPEVKPADPKALALPLPVSKPKTKAYIYTAEYLDGVAGCIEPLDKEGFAEELKSNSAYRGNIVILAPSKAQFRKVEDEILSELWEMGISRKRLRVFYVRDPLGGIELWILPRRK